MDWTPLEEAFVGAAATIITASAAVAAAYIRSSVKDKAIAEALVRTETMAAGIAHDSLTTAMANGAPDWAAAKQIAIEEGVAGVKQELAQDITPLAVAAALAPLLAVDPSVPAGTTPTATASAPAGGEAVATASAQAPSAKPIIVR
jgi:hypothetical protein